MVDISPVRRFVGARIRNIARSGSQPPHLGTARWLKSGAHGFRKRAYSFRPWAPRAEAVWNIKISLSQDGDACKREIWYSPPFRLLGAHRAIPEQPLISQEYHQSIFVRSDALIPINQPSLATRRLARSKSPIEATEILYLYPCALWPTGPLIFAKYCETQDHRARWLRKTLDPCSIWIACPELFWAITLDLPSAGLGPGRARFSALTLGKT